jgi:MFS family permease
MILQIFRSADFRSAAFGYFGHMWELYTLWAFIPSIVTLYIARNHYTVNLPLWSFIIIAAGGIGCIAGGYFSQKIGSSRVAFYSLFCSGLCCLCSFEFFDLPLPIFALIMIIWGVTVTADSPQFSTLVAQMSIPQYKGTALTIVTCIGFAITIASLQLINFVFNNWERTKFVFVLLTPGPLFGLLFLRTLIRKK